MLAHRSPPRRATSRARERRASAQSRTQLSSHRPPPRPSRRRQRSPRTSAERDRLRRPGSSRGRSAMTVRSSAFATQTAPAPAATASGSRPTLIVLTIRLCAGSIRATASSSCAVTQTAPKPTATLRGHERERDRRADRAGAPDRSARAAGRARRPAPRRRLAPTATPSTPIEAELTSRRRAGANWRRARAGDVRLTRSPRAAGPFATQTPSGPDRLAMPSAASRRRRSSAHLAAATPIRYVRRRRRRRRPTAVGRRPRSASLRRDASTRRASWRRRARCCESPRVVTQTWPHRSRPRRLGADPDASRRPFPGIDADKLAVRAGAGPPPRRRKTARKEATPNATARTATARGRRERRGAATPSASRAASASSPQVW